MKKHSLGVLFLGMVLFSIGSLSGIIAQPLGVTFYIMSFIIAALMLIPAILFSYNIRHKKEEKSIAVCCFIVCIFNIISLIIITLIIRFPVYFSIAEPNLADFFLSELIDLLKNGFILNLAGTLLILIVSCFYWFRRRG